MAGDTATIRVPRDTRDRLAAQARKRGTSVSKLLTQIARQGELEELWRSEREASLLDQRDPEVSRELAEWDAAPLDEPL